MVTFPCAKINLGLSVVARRPDGYHDIETVMYPVPLCDALEVKLMGDGFPSDTPCDLKTTGAAPDCGDDENIVVKAYRLLSRDFTLPRIHAHLYKGIPSGAGLGGGSSDAAAMIRLLDERFRLNIGIAEMERYAARLGADCAFFITSEPAYATGIGDILSPADAPGRNLGGYHIAIVKPDVSVSTAEAYRGITPRKPAKSPKDIVRQPIDTWREELANDFEATIFAKHPEIAGIKDRLYSSGAIYASMSGSGSAVFGIFREDPVGLRREFPGQYFFTARLE